MKKNSKQMRLLFDSSLWNETITQELYLATRVEKRKGQSRIIRSLQLRPRTLRRKTLEQSSQLFEAMSYVAKLAREGNLQLYDTMELLFEWMGRAYGPWKQGPEFDLFKDVKIIRIKPPVERVVVFRGFDPKDDFEKQKSHWLESIQEPRFLELKRVINRKHWADAFHLWTAETNGLDGVLTLENKVRNSLANQRDVTSPVQILSPFEVAKKFFPLYRLKRTFRRLRLKITSPKG